MTEKMRWMKILGGYKLYNNKSFISPTIKGFFFCYNNVILYLQTILDKYNLWQKVSKNETVQNSSASKILSVLNIYRTVENLEVVVAPKLLVSFMKFFMEKNLVEIYVLHS